MVEYKDFDRATLDWIIDYGKSKLGGHPHFVYSIAFYPAPKYPQNNRIICFKHSLYHSGKWGDEEIIWQCVIDLCLDLSDAAAIELANKKIDSYHKQYFVNGEHVCYVERNMTILNIREKDK